jgi:hypothetical protein
MNELILISTLSSVVLVPLILLSKYLIRHIKKCNCCCCSIETKERNNINDINIEDEDKNKSI